MDPHSATIAQKEFDQAQRELDQSNVLAALACLERALAIWDDPLWYSRLGYCVAKERGHLTRAFELCRSAIAHDSKNPIHYLYLGKVHQIAANQYEALQALRHGMTLGNLPEIKESITAFGRRKPPVIAAFSRGNPLNKYLGIVLTRLRLR
jgi:tetratricopeptide (TPR) repeat protein